MRKFEGLINGKIYTDENEFSRDLLNNDDDNLNVSYRYITVNDPEVTNECEEDTKDSEIYISEDQLIKTITNKSDVELDRNLIDRLKIANNKSEIKNIVSKKIEDFNDKIEDNLLHINELKSDYKKLDEKIKLINSQIKTLDNANNNYYLQKEYYTNIKNLVDTPEETDKTYSGCDVCDCGECKCECGGKCKEKIEVLSLKDISEMSPKEFYKYLNDNKMHNLSDLIKYFIAKCISPILKINKGNRDIWLVGERESEAKDNGYHLFKYIRNNHPEKKVYYVIDKKSNDLEKIKPLGNVIYHDSLKHYIYYITATKLVCAHLGSCVPATPVCWKFYDSEIKKKKIFQKIIEFFTKKL